MYAMSMKNVQPTLPKSNPLELINDFDLEQIWLTYMYMYMWGQKQ